MNAFDKENLEFFLTIDEETLQEWYEWADEKNIAYALSLFRSARVELDLQMIQLQDDVEDMTQANTALAKFKLQ
jgi:hypothetical protein